jgi:hypothetical protein
MDATWIMFFSKRQKVPSQEIRCNLLDERQRVCVAIFNEGAQELPIEPELDFIQMIDARQLEESEERGKRIEDDVVFGHWTGTRMLENSVV